MLGAIEGGGTKFLCAVGTSHEDVKNSIRIDTTTPNPTLDQVIRFFEPYDIEALGVGMFGPLDLRPGDLRGTLLKTPKKGWTGAPVGPRLREALGIPVRLDTDVNAAALGEYLWGAAKGANPVLYVTVGTGVGGGLLVGGEPVHGLMHPEVGHLPVPTLDYQGHPDNFHGTCPFHGRCLEGLASGPALAARMARAPETLPDDHPVWRLTARYIGRALASVVLVASPQRIVVGGGVGSRAALMPVIREELQRALGGYLPRQEVGEQIEGYVVPPGLGGSSGLAGAFALAAQSRAPA